MPTTYAHHRFGDDCAGALAGEAASAVRRFRGLFDTGVHGPDIFFYYHPLRSNAVSAYGSELHRRPARGFFENAREVFGRYGDRERMLAYLLGFLSHFVLDSACHGYVEEARRGLGISHNRLEALYDSHLMLCDGLVPSRVSRGAHLEPSESSAELIARFFEPTEAEVLAACRGQVKVMRLFYSPRGVKKRVLRAGIRLLGLPGDLGDLFIDDSIPSDCAGAMDRLDGLRAAALAEYAPLAEQLVGYLDGAGELSARFDRDFG